MPGHDIIVIGFSAGGVEVLARLVAALPRDLSAALLAAALLVVHHFPAESVSALPRIHTADAMVAAQSDTVESDTGVPEEARSDLATAERT